jgi:phosphinothricin acetyltransferase
MEIKIRDYKITDCPAILDIINDAILNSTALYDYNVRTLTTQEAIFEEKLQKGFPVIVAEMNNEVVGFGFYSEFRFREAYKFNLIYSS